MKVFEIIFLILFFVLLVFIPYLKTSKLYQFSVLLILPFMICYLAFSSYLRHHEMTRGSLFLSLFFLAGLIYQAIKFYQRHLKER